MLFLFPKRRFKPSGFNLDGANDYTSRGADLTGNADGKLGILNLWFKLLGGDGTDMVIIGADGNTQELIRLSTNKIRYSCSDITPAANLVITSDSSYTADGAWHHLLIAWSVAAGVRQMLIDGVDDLAAGSTSSNETLNYTHADHLIGARAGGGTKLDGDLAEIYYNNAAALDVSLEANLRKFYSGDGRPVDLGDDGSKPTGSQPIAYFSVRQGQPATQAAVNRGSGGNYTITGAFALASIHPWS